MKRGFAPIAAAAALVFCSGVPGTQTGLSAEQSALPKVGLTAEGIQRWATTTALETTAGAVDWETPRLSGAAIKGLAAMAAAERTALVREVLSTIKAALAAPAFRAAYAATIKKTANAVDHGIDTRTYADPRVMMRVEQVRQIFDTLGPAELLNSWEREKAAVAQRIKEETGEERATAQKDLARLNGLAPLKGKPDEFKKAYVLAKSASMGGPDTEAGMKAALGTKAEQDRIRSEQQAWNSSNIDAQLRRNLEPFVQQLSGIDFTLPIRMDDDYVYAADPKRILPQLPTHQLAYRLGRAPVDAAVQFMRTWLKELAK
jgi:hypothetical protein